MEAYYPFPEGYITPVFHWDPDNSSKKLTLQEDLLTVTVKDGSGFKTTLGNMPFLPGEKYFFQIQINKGSLIKIGVSRKDIELAQAFSDTESGWAIYNGELRHKSNSSGQKYGTTVGNGDVIGVMLDMIKGQLSFSKNGVDWGVAYDDEELKKGELYAAVAPIY